MNTRDILENYLNQRTDVHKEMSATKNSLFEVALIPFEPLFLKDTKGNRPVDSMTQDQLNEVISSMEDDLLPLFNENNFSEGIDKLKKWGKIMYDCLEKQK